MIEFGQAYGLHGAVVVGAGLVLVAASLRWSGQRQKLLRQVVTEELAKAVTVELRANQALEQLGRSVQELERQINSFKENAHFELILLRTEGGRLAEKCDSVASVFVKEVVAKRQLLDDQARLQRHLAKVIKQRDVLRRKVQDAGR